MGQPDPELRRGKGQRAPVDNLPDAGHQVLARFPDAPADDDDRRVQEVHHSGEHIAHVPACLAQCLDSLLVPVGHQADHVRPRRRFQPLAAKASGNGGS